MRAACWRSCTRAGLTPYTTARLMGLPAWESRTVPGFAAGIPAVFKSDVTAAAFFTAASFLLPQIFRQLPLLKHRHGIQPHPPVLKIQLAQKARFHILRETLQIADPPLLPLGIRKLQHNLPSRPVIPGIAIEHFESQTGYEGETVYFLEENTKEWYTYTSARPVFYEETGRRGRQEKAAAPWGLPVSVKEMVGLRLHLSGARCDARGRLSSSAETKGEVTGSCQKENCLHTGELTGWYYRDFGKLFAEKVADRRVPWLKSPPPAWNTQAPAQSPVPPCHTATSQASAPSAKTPLW